MNHRSADDPLREFPVSIQLPVAWGDMDAFGHVNNTVYFRYFESARIAYLDRIDFRGEGEGIGPILASTHCRFRRPLTYPDTVRVGARTTQLQDDRFTMEYRVVSEEFGETVAEGGGVVVGFDYGEREKAALPEAVRERIRKLEGSGMEEITTPTPPSAA